LVQIDSEGKVCVPGLVAALGHDDYRVVDAAAKYLGLLGPRAKDAVPALVQAMTRDFNLELDIPPMSASKALRRIGAPASSAVADVVVALKHRRIVRRPAGGDDENVEQCDFSAAVAAADVLGSIGAQAKAAVPYLVEAV
jgi:HEAT repeat protein